MRRLAFLLLRLTGLPFLLRELVQRRHVSILCYHDPRPEDFERHLRLLVRLYNVISLRHYLEWRRNAAVGLPPKSLVLTFDDGHRGNYELRHLLAQYRTPATIFLCSGIVGTRRHFWWKEVNFPVREQLKRTPDADRIAALAMQGFSETREYDERQALSSYEIEELRNLVDFQSHTRFHPVLPRCSDERVLDEVQNSKRELEERLGFSVYAIAYPNGDYTEREALSARAAGYQCGLTIDGGYNDRDTDLFRLRRLNMSDRGSADEVVVKSSGLWAICEKWIQYTRKSLPMEESASYATANTRY